MLFLPCPLSIAFICIVYLLLLHDYLPLCPVCYLLHKVYLLLLHDYLLLPSFHLGLSLPFCILPGIIMCIRIRNSLGLNPLGQNPSSLLYDKPLDLMTTMDNPPPPISHTSLLSTCLYHNSLVLRMLFHCALIIHVKFEKCQCRRF